MAIINNPEVKSLEELASENCSILFDTSIIISPLGKKRGFFDSKRIKEKADFIEENNNFIQEMRKYVINGNNFFTTTPVIEEIYNRSHYNYKKKIRKDWLSKGKELLRLRRLIKKEEQEKTRLKNAFVDNRKLIMFEGETKKLYERVSEKYQKVIGEYSLSHTDFDFLMTGITLAMTSNPVIFVSNDYKILYARNKILERDHLEEQNVRFFTRIDTFKFMPLFYHKSHKIEQLSGGS